jgi:hypothetical protein
MEIAEKDNFTVTFTDIGFKSAIERPYIGPKRIAELTKSNIVILPLENFRDDVPLCFHSGTRNIFLFLKEIDGFQPEICVEKDQYKEITLHSDELRFGTFLLTYVIAPIFVSVFSNYINKKLNAKQDDKVSLNVIVENKDRAGGNLKISYRGSPREIEEKLGGAIKRYGAGGKVIEDKTTGRKIDEFR